MYVIPKSCFCAWWWCVLLAPALIQRCLIFLISKQLFLNDVLKSPLFAIV